MLPNPLPQPLRSHTSVLGLTVTSKRVNDTQAKTSLVVVGKQAEKRSNKSDSEQENYLK